MGTSLLKGCIVGAIIVFVWLMISWMVIPWHCAVMEKFTNEEAVANVIMENAPKDGVYILPNICNTMKNMDKKADAMKKGPAMFAAIQRFGFDIDSVAPYIIAFIIQLIAAFFVTYMLLLTKGLDYFNRVWFVTVFGIAAGVLCAFPNWNWWGFSFGFAAIEFLDFVIGWFLAGLGIAAVIKK